ncbi:unnamed protein product [Urochloa humidicola]
MPIRIWPRANQFTADGQYINFFAPLPPPTAPAPQPPLGLAGQLPPPPQPPPQHNLPPYPPHQAYLLHLAILLAYTRAPRSPTVAPATPPALDAELTPPPLPAAGTEEAPPAAPLVQKRQSSRLAALNNGKFVHSTDKAMQRTALKNTLAPCSSKLKTVVDKRNMLTRNKIPLSTADLRKMVTAAGLGPAAADEIGKVPITEE